MQQYLRERKPVNGRQLGIYNEAWAIEGANDAYNDRGRVMDWFTDWLQNAIEKLASWLEGKQ